ncbi:hypothetical protein CYMTET_48967 [Cymbomonas tetramitiformis]|uniref:Uncharacterized protein n=1 Tax=Cymbomonas tetramitiformis TaxID=36881 RepID=A0AAE0EV74_9CHLO|nr:hypothetical protein CYMTET_48967 [Cymbomonas tetramitiformis]
MGTRSPIVGQDTAALAPVTDVAENWPGPPAALVAMGTRSPIVGQDTAALAPVTDVAENWPGPPAAPVAMGTRSPIVGQDTAALASVTDVAENWPGPPAAPVAMGTQSPIFGQEVVGAGPEVNNADKIAGSGAPPCVTSVKNTAGDTVQEPALSCEASGKGPTGVGSPPPPSGLVDPAGLTGPGCKGACPEAARKAGVEEGCTGSVGVGAVAAAAKAVVVAVPVAAGARIAETPAADATFAVAIATGSQIAVAEKSAVAASAGAIAAGPQIAAAVSSLTQRRKQHPEGTQQIVRCSRTETAESQLCVVRQTAGPQSGRPIPTLLARKTSLVAEIRSHQ